MPDRDPGGPTADPLGGGSVDVYDVVVLGGGPAGENVAGHVVQGGLSAVVVDAELVGGECSYWALSEIWLGIAMDRPC